MWIIKTNQELTGLCKYFGIVAGTKKKGLELRMDHGRVVTKIFESKLERRRRMGGPGLRWLEVGRDMER